MLSYSNENPIEFNLQNLFAEEKKKVLSPELFNLSHSTVIRIVLAETRVLAIARGHNISQLNQVRTALSSILIYRIQIVDFETSLYCDQAKLDLSKRSIDWICTF